MKIHKLIDKNGIEIELKVPEPCNRQSFFVFSLAKSGSTLLMRMVSDVCKIKKIPIVDLATKIFNHGIHPNTLDNDINNIWKNYGYAYLGFRSFFPAIKFDFKETKNILLVRDPRDMLVSLYFSIKYSHAEPKKAGFKNPLKENRERIKKIDINKSVIGMAGSYLMNFEYYIKNLSHETTRVYRYEDVIFKKQEWLKDITQFLDINVKNSTIKKIVEKYDIHPKKEDPHKHIRQVYPGNYKEHLSKNTINKLNELFEPILKYFNYDSVVNMKMSSNTIDDGFKGLKFGNVECGKNLIEEKEEYTNKRMTVQGVVHKIQSLISYFK